MLQGLTSAHSIISRHGGCIEIDSRINKGTTISIFHPCLESGNTEYFKKVTCQQGPCTTDGNILVLDDEEMIRNLTKEMLEHLGYKVTTCSNGEQAIVLILVDTGNRQLVLRGNTRSYYSGGMGEWKRHNRFSKRTHQQG